MVGACLLCGCGCTRDTINHLQFSLTVCLSVCLSVQGTPYDYHSPEATDLPYSTFSTLEHKRVHNMEPRYATPPPPVISERNEMHVVSLSSPPPMYGREDMV